MAKVLCSKSNLQVLYEDNHIIIVNKRAGDIVQGDKTGDQPLSEVVKEYIKDKYNKTGNVMFAKTSKALPRLNKLFSDKDAKKTYWAIVKNTPQKTKDTLIHWLKK